MKKAVVPLSRFSFAQKLDLMEELWADLAKDDKNFESPAWHGAILKEREEAYKTGKMKSSDWEEVKKRHN